MAAATLVERGVDVLMLDAGLRAPTGFVVRAAGNTIARRYGWSEYSTDRLDPTSARDVDWFSSLSLGGLSNYWTAAVPQVRPGGLHRRCPPRRALRRGRSRTTTSCRSTNEPSARSIVTAGDTIAGVPSGVTRYEQRLPADWQELADAALEGRATASVRCRWPRVSPWMAARRARSSAATTA